MRVVAILWEEFEQKAIFQCKFYMARNVLCQSRLGQFVNVDSLRLNESGWVIKITNSCLF